jgi:hypothetical protein
MKGVTAEAKTYVQYRGFILQVSIQKTKKLDGSISRRARVKCKGFLPGLKGSSLEEWREHNEVYIEEIELQDGTAVEYISHAALCGSLNMRLSQTERSTVKPDEEVDSLDGVLSGVKSMLPIQSEPNPPRSLSTLVCDAVTAVEEPIDSYIEARQVEIDEEELRFGLSEGFQEPISSVSVDEPAYEEPDNIQESLDVDAIMSELEIQVETGRSV